MIIDHIVSLFPPEVRQSDAMRVVIAFTKTLSDQLELTRAQLQATQEQFDRIRPMLESVRKKTRPRAVDLYDIFCEILTTKEN